MRRPSLGWLLIPLVLAASSCHGGGGERRIVVPAGTVFVIRLQDALDTGVNRSGDEVVGTTTEDVRIGHFEVVPAGTTVLGSLSDVEPAGRVQGPARMTIRFERVEIPSRGTYRIDTEPLILEAPSGTREDAATIAAGGIIGSVIGAIAGGEKGAAIGGAVGVGVGTAIVLGTRGEEIRLPEGTRLATRLESDAELPRIARR
jgi:hypothetical protein